MYALQGFTGSLRHFPYSSLNVAACYEKKKTFIFNFVICYRSVSDTIIIAIIIIINDENNNLCFCRT